MGERTGDRGLSQRSSMLEGYNKVADRELRETGRARHLTLHALYALHLGIKTNAKSEITNDRFLGAFWSNNA